MTPEKIDLKDYERSGEGFTAESYNHINGKTMVKMFFDYIPSEIPEKEIIFSQAVLDMGFTTPRPLRMVTDGKRVGNEYERIAPKKSFSRAIADNPEELEKYAVRFALLCKQLHETPCRKDIFPPVADFYRGVVRGSKDFSEIEKQKIMAFIDSVPEAGTCCHGDLHTGNVITSKGTDYWIDLSEFSWGNPLFDLGVLYMAAKINTEQINQDYFHLTNAQMRQIWSIFKHEYFGAKTAEAENAVNEKVAPFAALKMLFFCTQNHNMKAPQKDFILSQLAK